jgi:hypothetical protein
VLVVLAAAVQGQYQERLLEVLVRSTLAMELHSLAVVVAERHIQMAALAETAALAL